MFNLGYSELYFRNLECRLNNEIMHGFKGDNHDRFISDFVSKFYKPNPNHYDLDPSFYDVANRFALELIKSDDSDLMDVVANDNQIRDRLAKVVLVELVNMYLHDRYNPFGFSDTFLYCCMVGKKVCDLGELSFKYFFNKLLNKVRYELESFKIQK